MRRWRSCSPSPLPFFRLPRPAAGGRPCSFCFSSGRAGGGGRGGGRGRPEAARGGRHPPARPPRLRRLMIEAPGTFHHSVVVGTLAEAGAMAIGANPLLCRVAALFHDVGKISKPGYFTENQVGTDNVHDTLTPGMSRVVILSHVKEGVRLADEYRLGERIAEIIAQHHGTSLLYFFLKKAQPMIRERKESEESFRYPGPRPRNRGAAIIMLADAPEAAD